MTQQPPSGPRPLPYRGFTITLRHTTLDTTPLNELSPRRIHLYLTHHTTLTTDRHPCSRRDSNQQSQQASGRRLAPQTTRQPGTAVVQFTPLYILVTGPKHVAFMLPESKVEFTDAMYIRISKCLRRTFYCLLISAVTKLLVSSLRKLSCLKCSFLCEYHSPLPRPNATTCSYELSWFPSWLWR